MTTPEKNKLELAFDRLQEAGLEWRGGYSTFRAAIMGRESMFDDERILRALEIDIANTLTGINNPHRFLQSALDRIEKDKRFKPKPEEIKKKNQEELDRHGMLYKHQIEAVKKALRVMIERGDDPEDIWRLICEPHSLPAFQLKRDIHGTYPYDQNATMQCKMFARSLGFDETVVTDTYPSFDEFCDQIEGEGMKKTVPEVEDKQDMLRRFRQHHEKEERERRES